MTTFSHADSLTPLPCVAGLEVNHWILVVDDNEAIHDDFRKILESRVEEEGFNTTEAEIFGSDIGGLSRVEFDLTFATQGAQALQLVEKATASEQRFSLVFMDVRMPPGWDGLETARRVWDVDPDLQIVICTAYSDKSWEEMMAQTRNPERLLILKKPFDAIEVMQLAHSLTEKWALLQAARRNLIELENTVTARTRELIAANELLESETARHKAAAERVREQAMLLEKARDAIIVWDLDDTVRFWNHGAECLYGCTAEQAIGRKFCDLIDCCETDEILRDATKTLIEKGMWFGELSREIGDANIVTAECRWTLVLDDQDRPQSILGIHTDITAKKQLEANCLRTQRIESIGTLAGGIAHDLNNILHPITLAMDFLRSQLPDPASRNMLDLVTENAKRASSLVKQVLSFSRGEEGERVSIRPVEIAQEIARIVRETFPKNIELRLLLPTVSPSLIGDSTQLHQVLLNLCVNARDAMPSGGTLTIGVGETEIDEARAAMHPGELVGRHVVLTVSDTGTGIPRALHERIFDPFFTTKAQGCGTGIGLATTLSIVRSHNGFITLKSAEGAGTTFRVFIPATASEASPIRQSTVVSAARLMRGNGEMILIVDDEETILKLMRHTLETSGYRVVTASNGEEGRQAFMRQPDEIDAVITDMAMPVMDGPEMVAALKQLKPDVKVIAISGMATEASIARITRLGAAGLISKPFTASIILQTLRDVLGPTPELTALNHE